MVGGEFTDLTHKDNVTRINADIEIETTFEDLVATTKFGITAINTAAVTVLEGNDYRQFAKAGEDKLLPNGQPNPYYNEYSHQHANINYNETAGNGFVTGTLRALSEFLYQFPVFTTEDIAKRVIPGGGEEGQYQPYNPMPGAPSGIIDSFEDIGISVGLIDIRNKTGYDKAKFERQFKQWKSEKKSK